MREIKEKKKKRNIIEIVVFDMKENKRKEIYYNNELLK